MRSAFKKPLFILLAACYTFVAAAGNMVLLRELLNSGDSHQLTEQQQSRPLPGSPVWNIKSPINQILHADQSLHLAPAETIVNPDRLPQTYHFPHFQSKYTFLECLPSKPRDPPLA